jgi:hypothetical protein
VKSGQQERNLMRVEDPRETSEKKLQVRGKRCAVIAWIAIHVIYSFNSLSAYINTHTCTCLNINHECGKAVFYDDSQ